MKVIFDHQIFSVQEHGGVSRLFAELYRNLLKIGVNCDIPLVFSNNEYLKERKTKGFLKKINFPGKLTLIKLINQYHMSKILKERSYDIFHPTYFDDYFLKYIGDKPFVLTVFDLIHEKYYHDSPNLQKTLNTKRNLISKASKIISISQKTKKDLVDYYHIDQNKIEVVYPANSLNPSSTVKCKVPKEYILFVGSRRQYKNFDIVLRSMRKIDNQVFLVCAGGGKITPDEISKIKQLNLVDRVIQVNVNDRQLAYCYKNAICFIYPSLYEGFGIPILEAFSCDCPVLLSDIDVFKEVAGKAAIYFNPKSEDALSASINLIFNNENSRNVLIKLEKNRLKLYSWSNMARETLSVYKSIYK